MSDPRPPENLRSVPRFLLRRSRPERPMRPRGPAVGPDVTATPGAAAESGAGVRPGGLLPPVVTAAEPVRPVGAASRTPVPDVPVPDVPVPPSQSPTSQYPTSQYPTSQYPSSQSPTSQYPSRRTRRPSTQRRHTRARAASRPASTGPAGTGPAGTGPAVGTHPAVVRLRSTERARLRAGDGLAQQQPAYGTPQRYGSPTGPVGQQAPPAFGQQPAYGSAAGYPTQPGFETWPPAATTPVLARAKPARLAMTGLVLGVIGVVGGIFFGWTILLSIAAIVVGSSPGRVNPTRQGSRSPRSSPESSVSLLSAGWLVYSVVTWLALTVVLLEPDPCP